PVRQLTSFPPTVLSLRAIVHPALLTCVIAGQALAKDATAPGANAPQVVEVTGQRSADERLAPGTGARSLPGSVTTITAEDIATLNIGRDISNVFRRVPG